MFKNVKSLFIILVITLLLLSISACNRHKDSMSNVNVDDAENLLASAEKNIQPITQEELQRLMPPEFFIDSDGDGLIATNTYWLNAQSNPASIRKFSSIRASVGSGKKILFYTRLNTQWINFTSDLRQMLTDNGYTVEVSDSDVPLASLDLSTVDVLVIIHSLGTLNVPNDRPMSSSDKTKIRDFVNSGKGFFYTGDWPKADLPKFNDISGIFGVTMDLQYIDYIVWGRPPVTYYVPYWSAFVFDYINYYSIYPSQPILKKGLVFNYSCFSNPTHDIFKDVNSVLVMGSSFVRPRVPALAAVRTHPTTSRPRDWPIVPEGYPIVFVNEYGSGRYAMSCDTNAFANDGFATSILAVTDNQKFASNIFNWLAKTSITPPTPTDSLKILSPLMGSQFQFGESIPFIGEMTGTVTNIQWISSINEIFANTLIATYAGLSVGTHTITLRGNDSGGNLISTSTTIAVASFVFQIEFNPPEVRPVGTTNAVPTTVTVTLTSAGRPVANHRLLATATPVANSGGHLHDGNRPIGTFTPTTDNTLANGVFTTTYTPPQFGGTETIIIRSVVYPQFQGSRDLTVRFPGLELLPETDYYEQIGGTRYHPGPPMQGVDNTNHWGRPEVNQAIQQLARDFNARYRVRPPIADLLQFNDISLPNGGVFDIRGTWATNYHIDHREGLNVDFNHLPLNNDQRDWLWDQITGSFDEEPHPHPRPPAETHWHLVYARPLQGGN